MDSTKELVFFDKNGTNYGFSYNEQEERWEGAIYINPVSKGLFETEKLLIMQRYIVGNEYDNINHDPDHIIYTNYDYGYPAVDGNMVGMNVHYEFRWDEKVEEVDEIRMFGFNTPACPPEDTSALAYNEYNCPLIEYRDNVIVDNLLLDPIDYLHPVTPQQEPPYREKYLKKVNWSSKCAVIDISFCNADDDYSTFRRDLHMYCVYTNGFDKVEELVGLFTVYAKSIEEDERLDVMCNNLGYAISNSDYSILMDSDLKENLVDNELMNTKRKEMLLEGHNIYSHIGSYKSLLNAIRFFGYDNVHIREWWKNVDVTSSEYGKSFLATTYSLSNHEFVKSDTNIILPSKRFRKLNKLTMTYDIDEFTGNDNPNTWTGHAYPETRESFYYSIEEAVIKLYGLKRKLDKEFIPLNTHIVDITGEANAFAVNTLTHVFTANASFDTHASEPADFEILNGDEFGGFYISDLRPFGIHPVDSMSGEGIVGESYPTPQYIGDNLYSFYSADEQHEVSEFGLQQLQNYNTNFGLQNYQDVPVASGLQGILGIQGMGAGTCVSLQDYTGIQGINPPYSMYGDNLIGVYGHTVDGCEPWTFYQYEMERLGAAGNYYLADFSRYFPNLTNPSVPANTFGYDSNEYLPDEVGIPCGAVVRLKLKTREVTWNECVMTWNACPVTWDNIDAYIDNRSRIEWSVYKSVDETPEFYCNICGTIANGYGDIGIVLPYYGDYSVEMKVFDWNNNATIKLRTNCITVHPKSVDFSGWCKISQGELDWDSMVTWNELSCDWRSPFTNSLTWNEMQGATYESMDRATFVGEYITTIDDNGNIEGVSDVDESMMIYTYEDDAIGIHCNHTGPYFWNNLDCCWNDLSHLWWDAMCITGDIPCYFEFGYFGQGGGAVDSPPELGGSNDSLRGKWLEIVTKDNRYGAFRIPLANQTGMTDITDITRSLNASTDPVISMFTYSYVYDYTGNGSGNADIAQNEPIGFKIIAVAKNGGKDGDIKHVGIVSSQYHAYVDVNHHLHIQDDPNNKQLRFHTNSVLCNPTWQDCVCITNVKRIPAWTDINFNYANCRICGKTNPRWVITNLDTGDVYTNNKKNFHRMFRKKGCYNVKLTLDDTNGNTYTKDRNMFIIV